MTPLQRLHYSLVVSAGAGALLWARESVLLSFPWWWVPVGLAFGLVFPFLADDQRGPRHGIGTNVDSVVQVVLLVLLGPFWSTVLTAPCDLLTRRALHKRVYNLACRSLTNVSFWAALSVFDHPRSGWELAAAGALLCVVGVVVEALLVGSVLHLHAGLRLRDGVLASGRLVIRVAEVSLGLLFAVALLTDPPRALLYLPLVAVLGYCVHLLEAARASRLDPKTSLWNTRHFEGAVDSQLARGVPGVLAVIDMDHLREVNNVHGHLAGDAAIVGVANALRSAVRAGDVLARFGGEEFTLWMPGVDAESGYVICERLRRSVESAEVVHDGVPIPVRVSVGFALARRGCSREELVSWADEAAYRAKALGRNRVTAHAAA